MTMSASGTLDAAVAHEARARSERVQTLIKFSAVERWRPWMFDAAKKNAAPGLAPLFSGRPMQELEELSVRWADRHGIETRLYHFNLSGDPLDPDYVPCLAVPLHSDVPLERLAEAIEDSGVRAKRGRAVVVGAGIAGIVASRLLTDKYDNVCLIESAPDVGGLMRSVPLDENTIVDFGTHVPAATGHTDLDRVLFEGAPEHRWNRIDRSLKEGIFHHGKLDCRSGCLSADALPTDLRDRSLRELIEASPAHAGDAVNLSERLNAEYGPTLTEHLFQPVFRRLTGRDLATLSADTLETFSLRRIRMLGSAAAVAIKRSPALDARLAHQTSSDGRSSILKLYPERGGAGLWLDTLIAAAEKRGVSIRTRAHVSRIERAGSHITTLILDDETRLDCDLLVWTAPPIAYLKAAAVGSKSVRPNFIDMAFVHAEFDRPSPHDLDYVCCYDDGYLTYRVTFYSALRGLRDQKGCVLTAEILLVEGNTVADDGIVRRIVDELRRMTLIDPQANVVRSRVDVHRNALPLPTPESKQVFAEQVVAARGSADNVLMVGRNNFQHFVSAVLLDIYNQISNLAIADVGVVATQKLRQ
jgi:protoporphyrinogen oxidase